MGQIKFSFDEEPQGGDRGRTLILNYSRKSQALYHIHKAGGFWIEFLREYNKSIIRSWERFGRLDGRLGRRV